MMQQPWQCQADETSKAFNAFVLYRGMLPKERSLEKLRQKMDKNTLYLRQLGVWSSRWQWVKRSLAYDEHLAEVRQEAQEKEIKEMAERQAKEGMLLQSKGIERYRSMEPQDMSPSDALRALIEGAKLERTARGEPTDIQKSEHSGEIKVDVSNLSDEELLRLIALRESDGQ